MPILAFQEPESRVGIGPAISIAFLLVAFMATGCGHGLIRNRSWSQSPPAEIQRPPQLLGNPLQVGEMDQDFFWNQIVDTVDDYFQIDYETRMIKTGDQWLEGRIQTFPEIGASYLEPWRKDALPGFQRLQSSLQTIRRTGDVRITPNGAGYQIQVTVSKELEDVDRSLSGSDGSAAVRHDGSVVRTDAALLGLPITLDWIEQERDTELEQRILKEIYGRVTDVSAPKRRFLHNDPR